MVRKFEAVLNPQLRSPRPEIARVRERRNEQGSERSWKLRGKEQTVLPCDHGCVLPIQTNGRGTQTHQGRVHAIVGSGKSASKIKVDVAAGAVSYTHLRAHETVLDLVCRLLLEK